jgi:hypothetical protein
MFVNHIFCLETRSPALQAVEEEEEEEVFIRIQ